MRSHFPQMLAPLPPPTSPLPTHQRGSAGPQQPPLPGPLHCPTDHFLPKPSQPRCSAPHAQQQLSSPQELMEIPSQIPEARLPCSAFTCCPPPPPLLAVQVPASAATKCQPPEHCLVILPKALRLCCSLQSFCFPPVPGPGQCPTRAGSIARLSV